MDSFRPVSNPAGKILIVEDEADINSLLARILKAEGYETLQAYSGTEALLLMERETPALILLDLMLPGLSGEALLDRLRTELHSRIPVLILSARVSLEDKVALLRTGADDYITKPFEPEEVAARVQAALRRGAPPAGEQSALSCRNLLLFPDSRTVTVRGRELTLTVHEYELLYLLLQNPGKVYSRESLYELVWQGGYYGENNTVNVHMSNLRRKIREADPEEEYIQTVYGIGFRLAAPAPAQTL
ncbi:MAG: response regulator transcription factor [Lachnospiraceae bacterium]|nr:response regulator transcription factor [Lachnospiraceae bacterium]